MQIIILTSMGSTDRILKLLHSHKVVKIMTELPDVALMEVLMSDLVNIVNVIFLRKIDLSAGH